MVYTIERLQKDVLARLGEISVTPPSLSVSGVPTSVDIVAAKIKSILPEEGARLIKGASADELGGGMEMDSIVVNQKLMPCGLYAIEMEIPEDTLRLVSLKMSGWERKVSRLILPAMPEWDCQWSSESGIAGNPQRPRAYLEGKILRAIGTPESASLERFYGWRIPVADTDGNFDFPAGLYPDLLGAIASRILS